MTSLIKYILLSLLFTSVLNFSYLRAQIQDTVETAPYEPEEYTETDYLTYEGKVIGKIFLNVIDVAGPSVDEPNNIDTSWFNKLSNSLHFKSKDWVIRQKLLFKEGDLLSAEVISESERLLRVSGLFLDARIKVLREYNDSVDVNVITKDRWTLTLNLAYSSEKESYFGIKDDNFIGLGQAIDASVTHNNDDRIGLGARANYTVFNIGGTYINGGLSFEVNKKINSQAINLSRPFISTQLDWAGGVEFKNVMNELIFQQSGSFLTVPYKTRNYDVWIGRSFPVWFGDRFFRNNTKLILSGRVNKLEYVELPEELHGFENIFSNNILYLAKGGIIYRRFYKDYYIEGFGPTEDVPIGGILAFTIGTDNNGIASRIYSGIRGIYSRRIQDFGYASLLMDLGGFRKGGDVEQSVYNFNFIYHTPLLKSYEWKFRHFVRGDYLLGFRRFSGEQIYLNQGAGLRGIEGFGISGTKRGVLNLESRIFSPYEILGFVLGANVFIDLGLIDENQKTLIESKLYQGYGAGLRISNESIARAEFGIGIVYNPFKAGLATGEFSLLLSGSFIMGIRNFEFLRPYVTTFSENN